MTRFVPFDEDDAPPLTEEFFRKARLRIGGVVIDDGIDNPPRRGRPRSPPDEEHSLRLSPELLDWFRAAGDGWQDRIDEVLRAHIAAQQPDRSA